MGRIPSPPPPRSVGLLAIAANEAALKCLREFEQDNYAPTNWLMSAETFDEFIFAAFRSTRRMADIRLYGLPIFEDNEVPHNRLRLEGELRPPPPPRPPGYRLVYR